MARKKSPPTAVNEIELDETERAMLERNETLRQHIQRLIEIQFGERRKHLEMWDRQLADRIREKHGVDPSDFIFDPVSGKATRES